MLHENKRWVFVFDLSLESYPADSPNFDMDKVLQKLEALFKKNEAVHISHDGDVATRITGVKKINTPRAVALLIQYANKNASDPVFANLMNGTLREEPKLDGEGVAVSAHVLISLDPVHPAGTQYIAIVEEVPGLTRSHLRPFLTAIFRQAFDGETYIDPDTKREKKCRPVAELSSHTDQTLKEVLEGKKLQSIVLRSYKEVNDLDEDVYLKAVDNSVKLKVIKEPDNVIEWISDLRKKSSEKGYDDMRVFYKDTSRTRKQQQSVAIDKKQDAAAVLFTRQEEVVISKNMKQCHVKIENELCMKMAAILGKAIGNDSAKLK